VTVYVFFLFFILLVQELNDNLSPAKILQKTYLTTISWHDRLITGLLLVNDGPPALTLLDQLEMFHKHH